MALSRSPPLLAGRQPDIVRRFGHSIGLLRERIASRTPSTRSAFERMDGRRCSSSELRRRDTCEVAVGRCEHDAFRRWQFLERYAKPRARCEPGPRDVAVSVEFRILEIDERNCARFEAAASTRSGLIAATRARSRPSARGR